ncbi:ABC transporter ATP-binding protein [Spirillospora sp. NPDC047279]|uniref:ABC transporter ATP-binding protein n=1 Tax=Spirillospora sp. NPDC047279 TaxID=3155478 RepID=UPI0033CCEA05
MIVTRSLTKRYGRITAVNEVDLDVREGDRYGLLGPNGSGKTTLVRMILGLVYATAGEIEVLGRPIPKHTGEVLREVGALVEGPGAYGHLSGRANLVLLDAAGPGGGGPRAARRRRVEEALERVGLSGVDDRAVKTYSLGMRQRLGLAAALLHEPRLLVLDEPTNGLDPQGIREVRDLLEELNANGTTIFLCSHLLGEVEQLCTRVGVMDGGRLVLEEEMDELRTPTGRIVVETPDADEVVALLDGGVEHRDGDRLLVRGADAAELNARLNRQGLRISEIQVQRRSLEDVVLEATGPGSDRLDKERLERERVELEHTGVQVDGARVVEAGADADGWQGASREFLE